MQDDSVPLWSREAAYARLLRLQPTLPITFRSDPLFMESNSNDAWLIGDAVLRVCWRGDRARFIREAHLVAALPPSIPHASLMDFGSYEDLTWTLHERVAGEVLSDVWLDLPPAVLRDVIAQFASILAALHAWSPPADVDLLLTDHARVTPHGIEAIVDADIIPLPVPRLLALVEAAKGLEHVDAAVIASIANRVRELASADPFATSWLHVVHGDAVFVNMIVHDGQIKALLDFEWARKGPRDLELVSLIRMLEDARTLQGHEIPPVIQWLQEDYPQLFESPDLDRRLWLYALAYTVRAIVFWPPDRPETELFNVHQLHRLRRLSKAGMEWY
ncbi:MAG: aminoglycoside phosphotransferase family protein [Herpetosiphonaceae bacterium]|nr:aminoglycoside phosphotransferase family protein [Herpetosiphonaceae bacterium]